MDEVPAYSSGPRGSSDRGFRVGSLVRWDPVTSRPLEGIKPLQLYSNEEIFIGRDIKSCRYEICNPFISNRHVRVYTILFDQEASYDVAPLVYAEDLSLNGSWWNNQLMGIGNGGFLLSHGDMLCLGNDTPLRFHSANYVRDECFSDLQKREIEQFQESFLVTPRVLGFGAYGRVHMAIKKNPVKQLACKIVNLQAPTHSFDDEQEESRFFADDEPQHTKPAWLQKAGLEVKNIKDRLERNQREAKILAKLSHPNIITLEKVFWSANTMYIVSELLTGGDLFSFIKYKGGRLEDLTAASITRQIVLAVDYLHDQNIVHRDIKPDNILLTSLQDGCRVVVTDFGCAKAVNQAKRTSTIIGTREYCAPEIQCNDRGYTKAIDLWSLGCVTVVLVAGYNPFDDGRHFYQDDLFMLEDDLISMGASTEATSFIYHLLLLDEGKRMSAKQALKHRWFTNPEYQPKLEELYKYAVQGWKPVSRDEPTIACLKSTKGQNICQPCIDGIAFATKPDWLIRRHSSVDHVSESSYESPVKVSSPVRLPAIPEKAVPHFDAETLKKNQFTAFRDCRPIPPNPDDEIHKLQHEDAVKSLKKRLKQSICLYAQPQEADKHLEDQSSETAFKMTDAKLKSPERNDVVMNFFSTKQPEADSKSPARPRPRHRMWSSEGTRIPPPKAKYTDVMKMPVHDEKEENVYEELYNHLTGKKRKRIYGRDVESIVALF